MRRELRMTAPLPPAEPVLDPVYLADIRAISPDLAREVVARFREHAPVRLEAIRKAVAAGDTAALGREAHALRGSCSVIGAMRLIARCAAVEALARKGSLPTPDELASLLREFSLADEAAGQAAG